MLVPSQEPCFKRFEVRPFWCGFYHDLYGELREWMSWNTSKYREVQCADLYPRCYRFFLKVWKVAESKCLMSECIKRWGSFRLVPFCLVPFCHFWWVICELLLLIPLQQCSHWILTHWAKRTGMSDLLPDKKSTAMSSAPWSLPVLRHS